MCDHFVKQGLASTLPIPRRASTSLRSRSSGARLALTALVAAVLLGAGMPGGWLTPGGARAAAAQPAPGAGSRYFAATGHNLAEPFRSRWEAAGGEATLGPPLSEERYAPGAGGVLQTFAGLTLVFDPSQPTPFDVRGQPLDQEVLAEQAPRSALRAVAACGLADPACTFFRETGHTLSGRLADFWTTWGGKPNFGLPVSDPYADDETGAAVQVFENAVLEDQGPNGVRLLPLGQLLSEANGLLADPAFQPAPPTGGTTYLVGADEGLRLRAGPSLDAEMVALLPQNAEFIAAAPWDGEWVPGYADGFAGWVSAAYLAEPPPLPPLDLSDWNPEVWQGAALGETNVRTEPSTKARVVEELEFGDPVTVEAWVEGEELSEGGDLWARVGDGRYVYGRNIGRNAPVVPLEPPPDAPTFGKWIDIDLTQQLMTAYDGRTPARTVEVTTGMAGWETPPGYYQILSRVPNETMTSGAIGAEHHYKLEDVLFTQYFTDRGHAIHFAWWRTDETIGRPGSHGCINLLLEDARFFWDWATIGTPLYIHP